MPSLRIEIDDPADGAAAHGAESDLVAREHDAVGLRTVEPARLVRSALERAHRVGAFEGANYESRGFYRPQADCIMFTRDNVPFCAVCRRAIEAILDLYAR